MRSARARKRDENEPDIVDAMKARGCSVTRLDGDGVPDLVVGLNGSTMLVEVKKPLTNTGKLQSGTHRNSSGGRGDLTAAQAKWWDEWRGESPVIVRTEDDVDLLVACLMAGGS